MRLEKIDLIEWGWHRSGDASRPKGGLLWVNPEHPQFSICYDEVEGSATVWDNYTDEVSEYDYTNIKGIYSYMRLHKRDSSGNDVKKLAILKNRKGTEGNVLQHILFDNGTCTILPEGKEFDNNNK